MPVFISHRTKDDARATDLGRVLRERYDINCYLDHFDPGASTKDITQRVVKAISLCTHLLALITPRTVGSWWVPFEIGVATRGDRRITSFDFSEGALPEYLTEWPVLKNNADLDKFADAYHTDKTARPLLERYVQRSISTPAEFHARLKRSLGAFNKK